MSYLLALLMSLSAVSFAQIQEDPHDQPIADVVKGQWLVQSRTCSGGAPAHDSFVIGRDKMEMSFNLGNFFGHTKVLNCNFYMDGKYAVNGHFLSLMNVSTTSNCGQFPVKKETYVFVREGHLLKVYSGPMGPRSACPPGDYLETTFQPKL